MPIPSQRRYDQIHAKNVELYGKRVKRAYNKTIDEISELTYNLSLNPNNEFYFRNNPEVSRKVNSLLKQLNDNVKGITVNGINEEWGLAVNKQNELAIYAAGDKLAELPDSYKEKWFTNNDAARRSFLARKDNGLGLSDKIWKNTRQFKTELELSLDVGISKGKSATNLSRDIRGYLNEPDKLFRRVRDDKGVLRLSKGAKAYNPGQGRYRSSYKNALRLTTQETNMSYEGSQETKATDQDFIVGSYIRTSPSHDPADDRGGICCICLAGKYPKSFKWESKWHILCICYRTWILKSRDEIDKDIGNILSGKEPNTKSKNLINKNPTNFNSYINKEKGMWKKWKNQPRFLVNS